MLTTENQTLYLKNRQAQMATLKELSRKASSVMLKLNQTRLFNRNNGEYKDLLNEIRSLSLTINSKRLKLEIKAGDKQEAVRIAKQQCKTLQKTKRDLSENNMIKQRRLDASIQELAKWQEIDRVQQTIEAKNPMFNSENIQSNVNLLEMTASQQAERRVRLQKNLAKARKRWTKIVGEQQEMLKQINTARSINAKYVSHIAENMDSNKLQIMSAADHPMRAIVSSVLARHAAATAVQRRLDLEQAKGKVAASAELDWFALRTPIHANRYALLSSTHAHNHTAIAGGLKLTGGDDDAFFKNSIRIGDHDDDDEDVVAVGEPGLRVRHSDAPIYGVTDDDADDDDAGDIVFVNDLAVRFSFASVADISSLKTRQSWLTGEVVNEGLRMIVGGHIGDRTYGMWDSYAVHAVNESVKNTMFNRNNTSRSNRVEQLTEHSKGILVPFSCGGTAEKKVHWSLIYLRPSSQFSAQQHTIDFYDSIEVGEEHEKTAVVLKTYMNSFGHDTLKGKWLSRAIECPRQEDGWNCGVFVLLFALCIVSGQNVANVRTNEEFLNHARIQLANGITEHRAGEGPTVEQMWMRVFKHRGQ